MGNLEELDRMVQSITKIFLKAGFSVFPVGGCVRDSLLNRNIGDIDLATPARPEQVKALFRRVIDTGIKHGTVTVFWEGKQFEVTTFRSEAGYSDYRHPDKIQFLSDLGEDLRRRDFTVNAMAWDPVNKNLIDPFQGRWDLDNQILRCVGLPDQRFQEDPLRIFRLFRFQSQLGFDIEPATLAAAKTLSPLCERVSWERKRAEWEKLLSGEHWIQARNQALNTQMLPKPSFTPRLPPFPDALAKTPDWVYGRWAYHYWERGFSRVEDIEFDLVRFRSSRNDMSTIIKTWKLLDLLSRGHEDVESFFDICQDRHFNQWLGWVEVFLGKARSNNFLKQFQERALNPCPLYLNELPVKGNDLKDLGFRAGPRMGILLQHLLAYCRIKRTNVSKKTLLEYAEGLRNLIP